MLGFERASITAPFVLSAQVAKTLNSNPALRRQKATSWVGVIEEGWREGTPGQELLLACITLGELLTTVIVEPIACARLKVVEADVRLSVAVNSADASLAFDLADSAADMLSGRLDELSDQEFESLSEALLIAGVALKSIGLADESLFYMRDAAASRSWGHEESVALIRQEVMMQQDLKLHLRLLDNSSAYILTRPREYYRTLKRNVEFLLNNDRSREAASLGPELTRAFLAAAPTLSASARVSFFKNIAQLVAARGETYRALRLLNLCLQSSMQLHLPGQYRQIGAMMNELNEGGQARLATFMIQA